MQDTSIKKDGVLPFFLVGGFKAYLWLFAILFVLYLILSPFVTLWGSSDRLWSAATEYDGDAVARLATAAVLLVLLAAAVIIALRRRMTAEKLIFLLICAGFVLRFGYMLNTPFYIRGHDVGSPDGYGHIAYIYRIFSNGDLPGNNIGQFYHPPLSHIAGAAVAKIYALLTGAQNLDTILESARIIPCFASCALLILSSRLFDALDFSKRAKLVAMAVLAFHPTFFILSASINNDMLMTLFFMAAFLYTIRWYKDPSYKNILLLALSIGCAMSTKFSGALIAFFTAAVFLLVLLRKIRQKDAGALVLQFSAFAAVCFPLGLWYHIRNLKLFGQALGHVAQMGADSPLYVGNKTFAARFLSFSLPDMLTNVYCRPYEDFRLWPYTISCALFGEYTFSSKHDFFARVLIVVSLLLVILSLIAMLWFLIFDRKKNKPAILGFSALWALLMLFFVYFNIKYPFGCTMDFRYIVPTLIIGAAFLGLFADKLMNLRGGRAVFSVFVVILGVFCVFSAAFYIV